MLLFTLVLQFYLKPEENQSSATIMISVDGKRTVFPVKLKLGNPLSKDIKKEKLKKDPTRQITRLTRPLIILFQAITLFKSHLNA